VCCFQSVATYPSEKIRGIVSGLCCGAIAFSGSLSGRWLTGGGSIIHIET